MSIDADVMAAIGDLTGGSAAPAAPAPDAVEATADDVIVRTGIERPAPGPSVAKAKPADAGKGAPPELDPLDPKLYENLRTPEDFDKATKRILGELTKVNDLKRAAFRSHGAAETREKKLAARESAVAAREAAAATWDKAFQASMGDLQSGDPDRFLTGLHRLANVGDPAGFWRTISLKLASGGTFTPEEKKAAQADPEIQRRLEGIEKALQARTQTEEQAAAADFERQVAEVKQRNLETAKKNAATPRVVAYASDERTAEATRDALAEIMLKGAKAKGRPLTVAEACAELEASLAVHYELSQRADGNANGEKGTTGSGPDAGRETSKDSPKPDGQLSTIPTQLGSAPAVAHRPLNEREQREATVQGLERIGFFSRIGL